MSYIYSSIIFVLFINNFIFFNQHYLNFYNDLVPLIFPYIGARNSIFYQYEVAYVNKKTVDRCRTKIDYI